MSDAVSAGPADGIAPLCGVSTVLMVYEAGPANAAASATTITVAASARCSSGIATSAIAAMIASAATTAASPGQEGRAPSEQHGRPHAGDADGAGEEEPCPQLRAVLPEQRRCPMPTSAPIAGARATV